MNSNQQHFAIDQERLSISNQGDEKSLGHFSYKIARFQPQNANSQKTLACYFFRFPCSPLVGAKAQFATSGLPKPMFSPLF